MTIQLTVRSVTYQQSPSYGVQPPAVWWAATQQRVDRVTPPFQHELLLDRLRTIKSAITRLLFLPANALSNFFFTSSGTLKFTLATVASSFECSYALLIRMASSTTA